GREAAPGGGRPGFDKGEERDVVRAVVVPLDVDAGGELRDHGERREGHPALDEPRHVDVAARAAGEQVAAPEQRVRVEVGDHEPRVQRPRRVGGAVGAGVERDVVAPLDERWRKGEGEDEDEAGGEESDRPPVHGGYPPSWNIARSSVEIPSSRRWPVGFAATARERIAATSSSPCPDRSARFTSISSSFSRQRWNLPSAVSRMRLQLPQ